MGEILHSRIPYVFQLCPRMRCYLDRNYNFFLGIIYAFDSLLFAARFRRSEEIKARSNYSSNGTGAWLATNTWIGRRKSITGEKRIAMFCWEANWLSVRRQMCANHSNFGPLLDHNSVKRSADESA